QLHEVLFRRGETKPGGRAVSVELSSSGCAMPRSARASEAVPMRFARLKRENRHPRRSTELVRRAGSSRLRSWLVKRRTGRYRPNLRSILWFAIWPGWDRIRSRQVELPRPALVFILASVRPL